MKNVTKNWFLIETSMGFSSNSNKERDDPIECIQKKKSYKIRRVLYKMFSIYINN